jgi:N-acetyltransferase 10
VPYYIRQSENELTGEYTCVMMKGLGGGSGFEGFAQGIVFCLIDQVDK